MNLTERYFLRVEKDLKNWLDAKKPDTIRDVLRKYRLGELVEKREVGVASNQPSSLALQVGEDAPSLSELDKLFPCAVRCGKGDIPYCKYSRSRSPRKIAFTDECRACQKKAKLPVYTSPSKIGVPMQDTRNYGRGSRVSDQWISGPRVGDGFERNRRY